MIEARKQNFASIQAGRGIAALLVVLYHASARIFVQQKYGGMSVFGGVFDFGHAGVDFFFVLSGFIVAYVHGEELNRPERLFNYLRNRLLRVYPVYWLVLTGFLLLTLLPLGFNSEMKLTPEIISSSYFLMGRFDQPTVVNVAWTLFHEISFYFVFALAIYSLRLGVVVATIWLIDIACQSMGMGFLPSYLGDSVNLLFVFGVAVWWLTKYYANSIPMLVFWIGLLMFLMLGMIEVSMSFFTLPQNHLLYGIASALMICALISREKKSALEIPAFFGVLGTASYSIYLTHFPVMSVIAKLHNTSLGYHVPITIFFIVIVAVCVALGVVFHYFIELPLMRYLKKNFVHRHNFKEKKDV